MHENLNVQGQFLRRALLWNCRMERLRNTTLDHCCLAHSVVAPRRIEDILGFTLTLNCFSWKDVELNEVAFDLMLFLLTTTVGNDDKREVLKRLIGAERLIELERDFATLGVQL